MLEQQLERDLKDALLSGDRRKTTILRGLKNALLYAKVDAGSRDTNLPDDKIISILSKEAKKRQESANLYKQGGSQDRAQAELEEKTIIETYLPAQLSGAELSEIVEKTISEVNASGLADMGRVIAAVKQKTAGAADGATIAGLVKANLEKSDK